VAGRGRRHPSPGPMRRRAAARGIGLARRDLHDLARGEDERGEAAAVAAAGVDAGADDARHRLVPAGRVERVDAVAVDHRRRPGPRLGPRPRRPARQRAAEQRAPLGVDVAQVEEHVRRLRLEGDPRQGAGVHGHPAAVERDRRRQGREPAQVVVGEARVLRLAPRPEPHRDAIARVLALAGAVRRPAEVLLLVVPAHDVRAELARAADDADAVRAAVEEVAEEDEAVAPGPVVRGAEERVELLEAAVDVTDDDRAPRRGQCPPWRRSVDLILQRRFRRQGRDPAPAAPHPGGRDSPPETPHREGHRERALALA
jgi:hypothetical protein